MTYRKLYINRRDILYKLPRTSGVYYFYDRWDDLLYIGVAKILRSRITKHYWDSQIRRDITPTIDKIFDRVYWIEIEEISWPYCYRIEKYQIDRLQPLMNNESGRGVYYSFKNAELIQSDIMDPEGIYEIDMYLKSKSKVNS